MKVAIVVFAGTNCEFDTEYAFKMLGSQVIFVWHKDRELPKDIDLLVLPGGFSYGDYLRSGAIAKFSPIMQEVLKFAKKGGTILGICNGFQILLELKLLPGAMLKNSNVHFISKYHHLKVINNNNKFLQKLNIDEVINIPIAHGEGNYYVSNDLLHDMYENEQVILKYCDVDGSDLNPNGSVDSIAGICNKDKNIFALMPHPERAMQTILGSNDGKKMLEGFFE